MNFGKIFTLAGASALCAFSANAETVDASLTIDFEDYALEQQINTNGGGPNAEIIVTSDPLDAGFGNVVQMTREAWDTYARIPIINCPKGFTVANMVMITVDYYNPDTDSETPKSLDIFLKNPGDGWQGDMTSKLNYEDVIPGDWDTAVFAPDDFEFSDESKRGSSSFGLSFGFFQNPTTYYIDNITFYFEKEVSQREMDEAALDKATAACVELNFDDMEANPAGSPNIGSNGGSCNRPDMIIDKGPEGYDNNCVHIIYGGYTTIFLWDLINCPEGYTFDDLRLIEYDIYETEEPGVDYTNGSAYANKNGAPNLKVWADHWFLPSSANGSSCGNSALPNVNEWNHVEFLPSAMQFDSYTYTHTVGEGDDAQEVSEVWDSERAREEMGKRTSFNISVGFYPCQNQCYVDNVKLWFQKSATSAINDVVVPAHNDFTVYNLQGIQVMKAANENDVNNLPAGLYIVNGKKVLVK